MNIIDYRHTIPLTNYSSSVDIIPKGICFHITADTRKGQALEWFQNPKSNVSPHYIIEPDAIIDLCVSPNKKAYHAGIVENPTAQIILDNLGKNPNNFLIGIEVVANKNDINDAQFEALKELTFELCKTYNIPLTRYNLIGHYEICPNRRPLDPIQSYSINSVINGIKSDKKIEELQNKIAMLENYNGDLEFYKKQNEFKTKRITSLWSKIKDLKRKT